MTPFELLLLVISHYRGQAKDSRKQYPVQCFPSCPSSVLYYMLMWASLCGTWRYVMHWINKKVEKH